MEVELMVTKRDDRRQPGEYRAICLGKVGRQSFAIFVVQNLGHNLHKKCNFFRFGNSFCEKQPFTFGLFLDV